MPAARLFLVDENVRLRQIQRVGLSHEQHSEKFLGNWIFSEKVKPHTAGLGVSAVNWNQPAVFFVAAKLLVQ